MNDVDINTCRVCGYFDIDLPWGEDGKTASFDYCPCCGVQHGYSDSLLEGIKSWREKWISNDCQWVDEFIKKPDDFNPKLQMKNISKEYL